MGIKAGAQLLIIEDLPDGGPATAEQIAQVYPTPFWVRVDQSGGHFKIRTQDSSLPIGRNGNGHFDTLSFYRNLFRLLPPGASVIRVHNLAYAIHPDLWAEASAALPPNEYDYVLSAADECGLTGFFAERFNEAALAAIAKTRVPVLPTGYFNGMAIERSGRHWFSRELRQFYLGEQFDTLFDSPRSVSINAVPDCDYTCIKCQYHSPLASRKMKIVPRLPVDRFKQLLDNCSGFERLTAVAPTISGEPLLHPEIAEIVKLIFDAGYVCGFATNASSLSEEMSQKLVDAGVKDLAFSVDAVSETTYQKLQGGELDRVERNILTFQEIASRAHGSFAGTMNFVVSDVNAGEVEAYRKRWLGRGFQVQISSEQILTENNRPYFSNTQWSPGTRMPCTNLWHGMYVNTDGNLLACGAMGTVRGFGTNLFTDDPIELWRGGVLRTLRDNELAGRVPGFCGDHSCWSALYTTWVNEGDKLVCHNDGSWVELPPSALPAKRARPQLSVKGTLRYLMGVARRGLNRASRFPS